MQGAAEIAVGGIWRIACERDWIAFLITMEDFRGFWLGRGQYGAPRAELAIQNASKENTEGVGRGRVNAQQIQGLGQQRFWPQSASAWVAFAGDVVGLVFRLSVLAAFLWFLWTGMGAVADGRSAVRTEEGARSAGRTVDAFLGALSAPALAALGATVAAVLFTVVFVLRGEPGRAWGVGPAPAAPAHFVAPGPPLVPPWGNTWGEPAEERWRPALPRGVANPGFQPLPQLPPPPGDPGAWALEDDPRRGAPPPPQRRGLGRRNTVLLLALACVAVGP